MRRRVLILALAFSFAICAQAWAQGWQVDKNQVTLGLGYFSPKSGVSNVDFKNSTSFMVDYRYFFAKSWAMGFDYQYTRMDTTTRYPTGAFTQLTHTLPLHSFSGLVQYRFPTGMSVEPYVGAGLNLMVTPTDSNKDFYPESSSGFLRVAPAASANWGAMVQAGLDWRIKDYWVLNFDIRYIDNNLSMNAWQPYHGGFVRAGDYKLDVKPMTYSFSFGWRW